jgi:type III secretory pathway component EscT
MSTIKCVEVLYISVEIWYMDNEYEESYECLSILAEWSCMFLYCILIILTIYSYIAYELH